MMTSMRKQKPDRVPACPDISNMVPCRLTGKPFWNIYYHNDPPHWEAYLNAVKYFGMDGWFTSVRLHYMYEHQIATKNEILSQTDERLTVRKTHHTPAGDLTEVVVFPAADSPSVVEKMVKDFERDFPALKYMIQVPVGYDCSLFNRQKNTIGELGITSVSAYAPGLHTYVNQFEGGLEHVVYAMNDHPAMFDELIELSHNRAIAECKIAIGTGTDSVLTGGSGAITLSSPELWRKHSLPAIKEITRLCNEAGIISGIHNCGKEMVVVKTCAIETDLDYINPLEIKPMGDCTLREAREYVGNRLCLMGNIHTTNIMLNGNVKDVKRESLKALLDAGIDGAFVLSTGDQCGRDTPDENIHTLIDSMKEFGHYPINVERIERELAYL
jgi:uroporphyrinogen decarboxylase